MGLIEPYQGKFSAILLFGPPGAGKGTLGKFLASSGMQYHLSSGDIFRTLPLSSPAGKLYYSYASKGALLPDEATIEIWKYYVQGLIATNSYYPESQDLLLDGIPRTLAQAEQIQEFVKVRHIIVLEISNMKELLRRMQFRARIEGRFDDIETSVLEKRIKIYQEDLGKILDFYPPHLISRVDGTQKPFEVLRDVLVRLSHLLSRGPDKI
ncbi:MAG: nucleoside monophosphate kinase [Chlamydiales bacterium]|nr:nucleoside monophosphate kinase [Chlamydiales bacterium]